MDRLCMWMSLFAAILMAPSEDVTAPASDNPARERGGDNQLLLDYNQLDSLYHWLHLVLFYQYINTLITRSSLTICTSVLINQYIISIVITRSSQCTQHTRSWLPPPQPAWLSRPQWTSPRWWPWIIILFIFLISHDYYYYHLMIQTWWGCPGPRTAGSGSWSQGRGRAWPDLVVTWR